MATNKYFQNVNHRGTQRLTEDLVVESIAMHGIDVYYLPKTLVNRDTLFGSDSLKKFTTAAQVEVYVKDVVGFGGEGDILGKFGLEMRDQVTFTIARRRYEQIKSEKILLETGSNIIFEYGLTSQPYFRNSNTNSSLVAETATGNGYSITSPRPGEGDLVYYPQANTIFEIKFVEHEVPFYQFGALYTYDLQCEKFEYSSEAMDTGIADIDALEDNYSLIANVFEILAQNGDRIVHEDSSALIQEQYDIGVNDNIANNTVFSIGSVGIVDFSSSNPFSEL